MEHEVPEWMVKGMEVQVNPDTVRDEWTLAWIGSVGQIERIDGDLQSPIVVIFPGEANWFHFDPDELMQPVTKMTHPDFPEYVRIPRAEYEALKVDAGAAVMIQIYRESLCDFADEEFAEKGNGYDLLTVLREWQDRFRQLADQEAVLTKMVVLSEKRE